MERPLKALHSGVSPWKILITISIFYYCTQSTSAQSSPVSVVPNPAYGTMGNNVTLDIHGYSGQALSYTWYRGSVETQNQIAVYIVPTGMQIPTNPTNTREKIFPNGSLLISNLTLRDIGDYFIQIVDSPTGVIEAAQACLSVYESKPIIVSTNLAPVENKDTVSLTCQTFSQDVTFQWFTPKGPPAGDRIELSLDKRTLTIINVTKEDQGRYQCEIRSWVSATMSDPFILNLSSNKSPGEDNDSSVHGWIIAITVIVILVGVALVLCYTCLQTEFRYKTKVVLM